MATTVARITLIDPHHHDGDQHWDGDQTLWELKLADGQETRSVLAVVPRGDGYISAERVVRYVEKLQLSLNEITSSERVPLPSSKPQLVLPIEPG